jgi:hypothetical protein
MMRSLLFLLLKDTEVQEKTEVQQVQSKMEKGLAITDG